MLSRLEKYKKIQKRKKVVILITAIVMSLGIGSGVKTSFANADVSTLLINWFKNKESESIREIDSAITAEKTVLLAQMKEELKNEMASAQTELDNFTEQQKNDRIASLRQHAKMLIENLNIDTTEQKNEISAEINLIMNEAIAQMEKAVKVAPEIKPIKPPKTDGKNASSTKENEQEAVDEPAQVPATSTPEPAPITEPVESPESDSTASTTVDNVQADQTITKEEPKVGSGNN